MLDTWRQQSSSWFVSWLCYPEFHREEEEAGLYLPTPAESWETEDWRKKNRQQNKVRRKCCSDQQNQSEPLIWTQLIRTDLIQVQSEFTWILDPPEADWRFLNFYLKQEVRAGGAASSHGEFMTSNLQNCFKPWKQDRKLSKLWSWSWFWSWLLSCRNLWNPAGPDPWSDLCCCLFELKLPDHKFVF